MTGPDRLLAVIHAIEYLVDNGIKGDIVECGVWRGGSMMIAALTLLRLQEFRDLFLFDTFEGMPAPSELDGRSARESFEKATAGGQAWCHSGLDEVRRNMISTGYPLEHIHFVSGRVEETVPGQAPSTIALLRLDTDWYSSTRHELAELYPRLSPGGVLIIDDYGHWQGARRASDEYFRSLPRRPFLHRIDYTARLVVRQG
jgi:hypothetical protein